MADYEPSEHEIQVALFEWLDAYLPTVGVDPRLAWATPNGGHRHPAVAAKLKAEGVRAGVPDVTIAVPRHGFHGFYCELKAKRGRPSEKQLELVTLLRQQDYNVVIAKGLDEAMTAIKAYLRP